MARIVPEASKLVSATEAQVVVEGQSYDDVSNYRTKQAAADYAAMTLKLGPVAINPMTGSAPYRPLPDGRQPETQEDFEKLQQLELLHGARATSFRNSFHFVKASGSYG
jgi:hypothetical protein